MKNFENIKKDAKDFLNGFKNMFNDLKTKGKRHKQIPNLITLSRLGLACFIPPFALSGNLIPATIITIIAAGTDGIDGFTARKLNATSEFGKNLDPVCDKIFASALLIPLMTKLSPLMSLGLGINLVIEAGIAGVNVVSKSKDNRPKTTILGKIKTGFLSIMLATLYASFTFPALVSIVPLIYFITTTTQTLALINYYQIDKKKDIRKNKLKQLDRHIEEIEMANKNIETKDNNLEKNKNYNSEDYKKLKEEIIRTYSISTNENTITNPQDFQKIK